MHNIRSLREGVFYLFECRG